MEGYGWEIVNVRYQGKSARSGNPGKIKYKPHQGFFQQFWEKAPGQNWEKMVVFTSKLGEINDIEHNKGRKIYPKNQVIIDCIMSSIPL